MSEIINNEVNIPVEEEILLEEVPVEKARKGRPSLSGLKYDKENVNAYFSDYYRLKLKAEIKCECGDIIKAGCMTKHKKRAIHINKMKWIVATQINT